MPMVFTSVSDPIGTGFVESFSRPGGMITGFTNFEASMGSKWLELMHDLAPSLNRAAMLFNPTTANTGVSGGIYLPSMKAFLSLRATKKGALMPALVYGRAKRWGRFTCSWIGFSGVESALAELAA